MNVEIEEVERKVLYFLYYFTPLIQIWAGICLLFFYQKLLENSPLNSHIKKVNDKCEDIIQKIVKKYQIKFCGKRRNLSLIFTNWNEFVPRIKNMAALTFFYSLFILFVLCLGNFHKENGGNIVSVYLITTSLVVAIYLLICSSFNIKIGKKTAGKETQLRIFHNYLTPIIYVVFFIIPLYFLYFKNAESFILGYLQERYNSDTVLIIISLLILLTSLLGVISVIIYITKDWIWIELKKNKFKTLSKNVNSLYGALLHQDPLKEMPKNYQKKINHHLSKQLGKSGQVTRKDLEKFIEDEIQNEYNKILRKHSYRRKCKIGITKCYRKGKEYISQYTSIISSLNP